MRAWKVTFLPEQAEVPLREKMPERVDIRGIPPEKLKRILMEMGEPAYRAGQIRSWVFEKHVEDFRSMTDLPVGLRNRLGERFQFHRLGLRKSRKSALDDTEKFILELEDGLFVECVLIKDGKRRTACVSSQVGCARCCMFCATGRMGLVRNLTAAEMVAQVLFLSRRLSESGERLTNIVLMGMGEPMDNRRAVLTALGNLIGPDGLGIGVRRITLSTVGVVSGIRELVRKGPRINLAISLNAPQDTLRRKLMPGCRTKVSQLLSAAKWYREETGREVTLEYVLIRGLNDSEGHAAKLRRLLWRIPCKLNLICYNDWSGSGLLPPSEAELRRFKRVLSPLGDRVSVRASKGADISAACGQLAIVSGRKKA